MPAEDPLALPVPRDQLPAGLQRFADPAAPTPARAMAARGLVPVKGADLLSLLIQLTADSDATVRSTALKTFDEMPEGVLVSSSEGEMHPAFLHGLAGLLPRRLDVIDAIQDRVVRHRSVADETLVLIARSASEPVTETIALNQQRLLQVPKAVEALYHNRNTRTSTVDRLVELCARNGVDLTGVNGFKEHVEAIQGELIPEPTDEPLPSDHSFKEALAEDDDDPEAVERGRGIEEDEEKLKDKFRPLRYRIGKMSTSEKIRFAEVGNAAGRAILVREPRRIVAMAAVRNMTDVEATQAATSKEISEDVLRFIGFKKEWLAKYDIKRALVFNPKTPTGIALRFIAHMRDNDLKTLTKSRNVAAPIKAAANQRWQTKQKGRR